MPISKDIMLSILAMDSYNRGYEEGIVGLGGLGSKIGNATFSTDSETLQETAADGQALNFYAISYEYGSETIISYRGTDSPSPFVSNSDFWKGWLFGTGVTAGTQLSIARTFYEEVAEIDPFAAAAGSASSDITLVGHSLGGGLAGHLASLTGDSAHIFDNEPFGAATIAEWIREVTTKTKSDGSSYSFVDALNMLTGAELPTGMSQTLS